MLDLEDRLILGDPSHVRAVQRVFRAYESGNSMMAIYEQMVADGEPAPGRGWTIDNIKCLLKNEIYTGDFIWGDRKTGKYKNLTNTLGYDAEGSWSPDGKLIAFTSNRRGYEGELTDEEKENFKIDPAYLNEIYLMNADGSNVRRLTSTPGYDGGPFFSPDAPCTSWPAS